MQGQSKSARTHARNRRTTPPLTEDALQLNKGTSPGLPDLFYQLIVLMMQNYRFSTKIMAKIYCMHVTNDRTFYHTNTLCSAQQEYDGGI